MGKSVTWWLYLGCLLVFLMVFIGGITRLTGSGLSIVEWNLISGTLPPLNDKEWEIAFEKYKQFPEYQKLNTGMKLREFKYIFFWEYIHRFIGRLIGIVFIVPFIFFYVRNKLDPDIIKRLILILILGGLQGAMGWFMVKSGLVDNPHVSHYRLAAHFLLACLLISLIYITALDTIQTKKYSVPKSHIVISISILSLIVIQLLYGAFTAGLKAGFAYNTFPTMNGEWIPQGILGLSPIPANFFNNGITVQFIHRMLGSFLLAVILSSTLYIYKTSNYPNVKIYFTILSVLATAQFLAGIATLVNGVPVYLGVIHQSLAIILLLSSVTISYKLKLQKHT